MKRTLLLTFLALGAALPVAAQDNAVAYRKAAAAIDADLRKALDELAAQRTAIAAEKPPLAIETERIAADLREKRRQADLARTTREAAAAEAEKAVNDLKAWRDEKLYIESLLGDFRRTATANEIVDPAAATGQDGEDPLALGVRVLERLGLNQGILVTPGSAISPEGILVPGQFAKGGPVRLFLADDASLAGLVGDGADLTPKVVRPVADANSIHALVRGQRAPVEFDPTLGLAVELAKTETTLLEHVKAGGFWIYPILLLALIAMLTAIVKWIQLSKIREVAAAAVQRVIDAVNGGELEKAGLEAGKLRHPARRILEQGIAFVRESPGAPRDDLEEALYEKYLEASPPLQRGLPLIAIAAATAPLLGLLGTVTGMMETFRLITVFGSGDAKQLASGIAEALITTEFGLIVAIPSLILHALLSRKVQGVKSTMEMASLAFLNGIQPHEQPSRAVPERA